ncbi:33kDa oxygen evolving of photosystem II isoform A [Micractinium conductrix]|uniref:33kDa oxygen evolving of photosystem II isoform A n=1 Tax=Micractinium conductrix TaxID=554055 RepID=A0A2P6VHT3_9CHLO|nr:33kDa oxygen evolving of photosystem II isoform A [Micractinium conductrix]|eukprot:PSC73651.1 33kDa oxygen evolving of photosystem II isoform A [Micractinium conductrix]
MVGTVTVGRDGTIELKEKDGIEFAPATVKIRGGEMVPFLFTVKNLDLKGPADGFAGQFDVPSYRGATFMDPQGRGAASGWDYVKGLQAAGAQDAFASENVKSAEGGRGEAAFSVAKLADDDLGAKEPAEVLVEGVWYGQLFGTGARPAAPAVRAVPAAGAVGKQLASLPAVPVPALVLLAAAAAMFGFLTWWLSDKRRSSLWKAYVRHASLPAADKESAEEAYALQKARVDDCLPYLGWCSTALTLLMMVGVCFPGVLNVNAVLWAADLDKLYWVFLALSASVLVPMLMRAEEAKVRAWAEREVEASRAAQ